MQQDRPLGSLRPPVPASQLHGLPEVPSQDTGLSRAAWGDQGQGAPPWRILSHMESVVCPSGTGTWCSVRSQAQHGRLGTVPAPRCSVGDKAQCKLLGTAWAPSAWGAACWVAAVSFCVGPAEGVTPLQGSTDHQRLQGWVPGQQRALRLGRPMLGASGAGALWHLWLDPDMGSPPHPQAQVAPVATQGPCPRYSAWLYVEGIWGHPNTRTAVSFPRHTYCCPLSPIHAPLSPCAQLLQPPAACSLLDCGSQHGGVPAPQHALPSTLPFHREMLPSCLPCHLPLWP